MSPHDRETTIIAGAGVVEGHGLRELGQGEDGGGAVLHEAEAEVEDE